MTSDRTFTRAARYAGVAIVLVYATAYVFWRPAHVSGPMFGDFIAYYAGGRAWITGADPYKMAVWSTERGLVGAPGGAFALLPFVAPPASLPLWGALALLPFSVAAVLWGALLLAAVALLLTLPSRIAAQPLDAGTALPLALLALIFGPIVDAFALGQPALPAAAAVGIAILCASRRRWIGAGVAVFTAALFNPNVALVTAGTLRDRASFVAYGAAGALAILANLVVAGGPAPLLRYVAITSEQTRAEAMYVYQYTATSIAHGYGFPAAQAATLGHLVQALAVLSIIAAIVWSRAGIADGGALASAGWPFVSPFVHEADLAVVVLPALLVVYRARGITWFVGATGCVLVAIEAFALGEPGLGIAFAAVAATVAATQFAALAPRIASRVRVLPVLLGFATLGLGDASRWARPLPVWPRALPVHFTAPAESTAATAWMRELAAIHLDGVDPGAASLRTLTLLGCACILGALAVTARTGARGAIRRRSPPGRPGGGEKTRPATPDTVQAG